MILITFPRFSWILLGLLHRQKGWLHRQKDWLRCRCSNVVAERGLETSPVPVLLPASVLYSNLQYLVTRTLQKLFVAFAFLRTFAFWQRSIAVFAPETSQGPQEAPVSGRAFDGPSNRFPGLPQGLPRLASMPLLESAAKVTKSRLRGHAYAAKVTLPRLHSQG